MSMNRPESGRRRLPHLAPLEFANQTTVIFLTMCVEKRRPLLARAEIVALLQDCWRQADHWLVGRWVAMPDHLHLFPATFQRRPLVANIVQTHARIQRAGATVVKPCPGHPTIVVVRVCDECAIGQGDIRN
jgi:hypothetical protein